MSLPLTSPAPPVATAPASSTRIAALDWTKGALVVCMVIYHAINYSVFRPNAFVYLGFLPPSFILIAGFLVGQVYAAKYNLRSWQPYRRLAIRGLKLLVLFSVLNLVFWIATLHSVTEGLAEFGERADTVFLSGNGREGIFEVLLPIAYFLLLAPGLLWLRARAVAAIVLGAAAVFLACFILERNGLSFKNLDLLSVGIFGMAFGLIPMAAIDRFATRWVPVLLLYLAYHAAGHWLGQDYAVQVFGAVASVLVLYCLAAHLNLRNWLGRQVILLGNYSLFGYLAQIAFLRAIVMIAHRQPSHRLVVAGVTCFTIVALYALVQLVRVLREKSRAFDAAYKAVFA